MKFLNYCQKHSILVAVYPPHSTHKLQPLDVGLFSPLATFYSKELNTFTQESQGLSQVKKRDFFRLFWLAYEKAFTSENILSAFQKTGINPLDPSAIDASGSRPPKPPLPEPRPPTASLISSAISSSD